MFKYLTRNTRNTTHFTVGQVYPVTYLFGSPNVISNIGANHIPDTKNRKRWMPSTKEEITNYKEQRLNDLLTGDII